MYSLLVADDEPLICEYLTSKISEIDRRWSVAKTAKDGQEALDFLKNHMVDLVITDIKMPIVDGITLCTEVKKLYPHQNFAILSGYDDFVYAQQAIGIGVKAYLLKPIKLKALIKVLDDVVDEITNSQQREYASDTLKKLFPHFGEEELRKTDEKSITDCALEFIHTHFAEPIMLINVADIVGVSPNYLSKLFHDNTGGSYIKYVTKLRMEYAAVLLKENPDLKILCVAEKAGYYNLKHFNYVFKKYYKTTPSDYQKLNQ